MVWSANLHHSQLSTCLDNSCPLSPPPPFEHFCSQRADSGYLSAADMSHVIGGAVFRWALRFCLCTITLLSASQSAWTPRQQETRRTLVCNPLITNSEHLYAELTCRSGGAFSFSHREETLNDHFRH